MRRAHESIGSGAAAPLAARARTLEPFLAMEVMERAFGLERSGIEIAHLELGEPDFPAPAEAAQAAARALSEGDTRYTDSRGLLPLREAIAADIHRRHGVEVSPERVLVTAGTSPAMLLAFSLLVEPGSEVLMSSPHYPCYPNFVRYCGGVPIFVPSRPEDGYRIDIEAWKRALSPRTAALVVNSPSNPTGAVQTAETLEALCDLGVPVVSDEIYGGLVYDKVHDKVQDKVQGHAQGRAQGQAHREAQGEAHDASRSASVLQFCDRALVLDGFSKRYAMTGFRLGYLVAPEDRVRPLQIMLQNLFISASPFVQRAGIAALEHGAAMAEQMRCAYQARRELMVNGLRALGFGVPQVPDGAFYVLADARRFGDDSLALAYELLDRAHVGTAPGIDFGAAAEGMLRFCYAVAEPVIEQALERLAPVLSELAERRS